MGKYDQIWSHWLVQSCASVTFYPFLASVTLLGKSERRFRHWPDAGQDESRLEILLRDILHQARLEFDSRAEANGVHLQRRRSHLDDWNVLSRVELFLNRNVNLLLQKLVLVFTRVCPSVVVRQTEIRDAETNVSLLQKCYFLTSKMSIKSLLSAAITGLEILRRLTYASWMFALF